MFAKIYQPARSAMTSGNAKSCFWVLEYVETGRKEIDPLTGTVRSTNMRGQIQMKFDELDEAISYAKSNGIPYNCLLYTSPSPRDA